MYQTQPFNGADLPTKTLCLTFDDGPGNQTLDIARFLFQHQIKATFFVVGKYAYHHPEILLQLKQMDHLIGNHTYDHPDLPYYLSVDGDVLDQVLRTDVVIKPFVESERIYFRSPYGKWSVEVAQELNQNILTANHIGPIYWEVPGVDCYYWQNDWPVAEAVKRYLTDIERVGHGIVVMHDDIADMDVVKPRNKTLDLLKILIPQLLEMDYKFVRLDEIPSIKTASAEKETFTLRNSKGEYLSLKDEFELWVGAKPENNQNLLQLENLDYGKVAIKAANNLYLSINDTDDRVVAKSSEITKNETFDMIPVNATGLVLRCTNGNFLTIKDKKLISKAQYIRKAEIFSYANHNSLIKNNVSLYQRLKLFKRQFSFIRSKLSQKIG